MENGEGSKGEVGERPRENPCARSCRCRADDALRRDSRGRPSFLVFRLQGAGAIHVPPRNDSPDHVMYLPFSHKQLHIQHIDTRHETRRYLVGDRNKCGDMTAKCTHPEHAASASESQATRRALENKFLCCRPTWATRADAVERRVSRHWLCKTCPDTGDPKVQRNSSRRPCHVGPSWELKRRKEKDCQGDRVHVPRAFSKRGERRWVAWVEI